MKVEIILSIVFCFCCANANSQEVIKIEDISKHIGDTVKICTKIYGGRFLYRLKNSPTFLEVGDDYPNQLLTIVIWGKDLENFEDRPEMMYVYRDVCITGKLELDNGKPQIIVSKPTQIVLQ